MPKERSYLRNNKQKQNAKIKTKSQRFDDGPVLLPSMDRLLFVLPPDGATRALRLLFSSAMTSSSALSGNCSLVTNHVPVASRSSLSCNHNHSYSSFKPVCCRAGAVALDKHGEALQALMVLAFEGGHLGRVRGELRGVRAVDDVLLKGLARGALADRVNC